MNLQNTMQKYRFIRNTSSNYIAMRNINNLWYGDDTTLIA